MHDGKQLVHAFDGLWDKYRKRLTACRRESSENAVHSLRIGTRRLLSSIELFQALAPQRELRKLRKALKAQLDSFDELRDTQVMWQEIAATLPILPELAPFLHHLTVAEQRLLAQTPANIEHMESSRLQPLVKKAREHLLSDFGKADLKPRILACADGIYGTAMERFRLIDIAQPVTIHHTRIAVKKLRYLLESADILLPPLPDDHLQRIHDYLSDMGRIQDSCVLLLNLKNFFSEHIPASVETHYRQRHGNIINAYMLRRDDIKQFWRTDPASEFPWTKRS
ncbi:MAG: CHAD domain-containing protein [Methylomonas sp.]|nr:CHAD domain-containing protein [Methylomonas sp.]